MSFIKRITTDYPVIGQAARFVVVGFSNVAVDLVVLNLLIYIFHTGKEGSMYAVFKGISFLVAVINSYIFNRLWVFASKKDKKGMEFVSFLIVSVVGAVVNIGIATAVATLISPIHWEFPNLFTLIISDNLWPTIGALCGTVFGLVWNFFGYKFIVFKKKV